MFSSIPQVLPAAAFLELAAEAGRLCSEPGTTTQIMLMDVTIPTPLLLPALSNQRGANGAGDLMLVCKVVCSTGAVALQSVQEMQQPTVHMRGILVTTANGQASQAPPLPVLPSSAARLLLAKLAAASKRLPSSAQQLPMVACVVQPHAPHTTACIVHPAVCDCSLQLALASARPGKLTPKVS